MIVESSLHYIILRYCLVVCTLAWTDPLQLNAGWLSGLVDINTEKPSVQDRVAAYLTDLLSIGFSGFRIGTYSTTVLELSRSEYDIVHSNSEFKQLQCCFILCVSL